MKRSIAMMMVVAVALPAAFLFSGCARTKEEAPQAALTATEASRRLMIEGTVFLKQGEVVKAVECFATAIKVAPDSPEAYFMLGETFVHLKQFGQAQSLLTAAAKRFPDNPAVYYLLAVSYQGSNDLMPAIVAARKSVDLYQAARNTDGQRRATVLLGVLVQIAKNQAEAKMVETAAQEAATTKAN